MSRYRLDKSRTRPEWWVLTDTRAGVVIQFRQHHYNDDQHVTFLNDPATGEPARLAAAEAARTLQEMGQWMHDHHIGLAIDVVYGIEQAEDDGATCLVRYRAPRWRLALTDDADAEELARSLNKAAEWLRKSRRHGRD